MVTSSKHKTFFFRIIYTRIRRGVRRDIKEPLWGRIQCVRDVLQSHRLQPPPTALPCPALPCPSPVSTGGCLSWPADAGSGSRACMLALFSLGQSQWHQFGTCGLFLFSLSTPPSSRLPSCSCSVHFSRGWGACGPVGRGLIPSARGFCRSLVPFCVMVLTERTPHLTPIELWGWAAGRPARANAAPCSAW